MYESRLTKEEKHNQAAGSMLTCKEQKKSPENQFAERNPSLDVGIKEQHLYYK